MSRESVPQPDTQSTKSGAYRSLVLRGGDGELGKMVERVQLLPSA